jgi:hypothetical protein
MRQYESRTPCATTCIVFAPQTIWVPTAVKRNYNQVRRQKELTRKARQQQKQERRLARPPSAEDGTEATPAEATTAPPNPGTTP